LPKRRGFWVVKDVIFGAGENIRDVEKSSFTARDLSKDEINKEGRMEKAKKTRE